MIPIIDLRNRLGMPMKEHGQHTRTIVVELAEKVVGFVVDAVSEVLRIDRSTMEVPPSIVGGIASQYIKAIGRLEKSLMILLDLEKVHSETEKGGVRMVA